MMNQENKMRLSIALGMVLNVGMGALVNQSPQSIRVRTNAVTAGAPYAACGDLR